MTISYSWKITGVKAKDEGQYNNAVVQVYWTKTGTNSSGASGKFKGVTPFSLEDINADDFTPFENLSESAIIEWVKTKVVGEYETFVNDHIQSLINSNSTPAVDLNPPWNVSVKAK